MIYFIGTYEQCKAYNDEVVSTHNHTGKTTDWATPRKHPDREEWAIIKAPTADKIEGMKELLELTEDWITEINDNP